VEYKTNWRFQNSILSFSFDGVNLSATIARHVVLCTHSARAHTKWVLNIFYRVSIFGSGREGIFNFATLSRLTLEPTQPANNVGSFPEVKVAVAWSWPLTSIYCRC